MVYTIWMSEIIWKGVENTHKKKTGQQPAPFVA